jgi:hypothetical protein
MDIDIQTPPLSVKSILSIIEQMLPDDRAELKKRIILDEQRSSMSRILQDERYSTSQIPNGNMKTYHIYRSAWKKDIYMGSIMGLSKDQIKDEFIREDIFIQDIRDTNLDFDHHSFRRYQSFGCILCASSIQCDHVPTGKDRDEHLEAHISNRDYYLFRIFFNKYFIIKKIMDEQ